MSIKTGGSWTGFLKPYHEKHGEGFAPYRHFDLDYIVTTPNMDPRIQPFEVVDWWGDEIGVSAGFAATIRRSGEAPMPRYERFSIQRPEEMAGFGFDPADDPPRFLAGGDDQIHCVGDALHFDLPQLLGRFVDRIGDFTLQFTEAQIEAGGGRLAGMYVWGDVAYVGGTLFGAAPRAVQAACGGYLDDAILPFSVAARAAVGEIDPQRPAR